ncbi:MAG: SAM-dependent methyltransferase, partial [Planctomycetota bacterium]|nr:SAM-dependent methyltransferase [Planctomycetota bacterium]
MLELRCTVRKCGQSLVLSEAGLGCGAGHHFDQAKEGYWNLTQPQDKKSTNP